MGETKIRAFRLADEVIEGLDRLIEHYSREMGTKINRTDIIRILVSRDLNRIAAPGKTHRKGKCK